MKATKIRGSIRQNGEKKTFSVTLKSDPVKDLMREIASISVIKRYLTKDLSDILPLVFVLFAKYCDSKVVFDTNGHIIGYDKKDGEDGKRLNSLYRQTMGIVGETGKCREAEELKKEIEKLDPDLYHKALPKFLVHYIAGRKSIFDTRLWPQSVKDVIKDILAEREARRIYEYRSGLGMVSKCYKKWDDYTIFEPGRMNLYFSEFMDYLVKAESPRPASHDYLEDSFSYDAIIANLLDTGGEPEEHVSEVKSFFRNVLKTEWQTSLILVDYHFCVSPSYETIRKKLCTEGILDTAIMAGMLKSGVGPIAILVLDKSTGKDGVIFKTGTHDGRPEIRRPYLEFEKRHWVLEPDLYQIDGPTKEFKFMDMIDGFIHSESKWDTAIRKGELHINLAKPKSEVGISERDFQSSPIKAFCNVVPHAANDDNTTWPNVVTGPAVSILLDGESGCRACRVNDKTTFLVPKSAFSFRVSENADVRYVINALFTDRNLVHTLIGVGKMNECFVREKIRVDEEYMYGIIANSPIDDFPDKKRQAEKARAIEDSLKEVLKTDDEYRILLVGNPLDDIEKGSLAQWLVSIAGETKTIEGKGSLEQLLAEDRQKPVRNIDAVVIDTTVGYDDNAPFKYFGVWNALRFASQNMPVFLYTDKPWNEFGPMADMLLNPLKTFGGYVQKKDASSIKDLVRSVRNYLDEHSSPSTAVKRDYSLEIEVVNHIDPTGSIAGTIIESLSSDIQFQDSEKKLNGLRIAADTIFNNAKEERKILPNMVHLGQFQQLLLDGEYFDNNTMTMYRVQKGLMPETLVVALGYFVSIINPASHGTSERFLDVKGYILTQAKSLNIFKSCLYILLDLLRWYKEIMEMDTAPKYEVVKPFKPDDVVMKTIVNGRDYYYLGRVHLEPKNGIEGLPGSKIKLVKVSKEKQPIGDIILYSNNYNIQKD